MDSVRIDLNEDKALLGNKLGLVTNCFDTAHHQTIPCNVYVAVTLTWRWTPSRIRLTCLKLPIRSMASRLSQCWLHQWSDWANVYKSEAEPGREPFGSHFCPSHHTSFPRFSAVCFHTVETLPSNIPLLCLVSFYRPSFKLLITTITLHTGENTAMSFDLIAYTVYSHLGTWSYGSHPFVQTVIQRYHTHHCHKADMCMEGDWKRLCQCAGNIRKHTCDFLNSWVNGQKSRDDVQWPKPLGKDYMSWTCNLCCRNFILSQAFVFLSLKFMLLLRFKEC